MDTPWDSMVISNLCSVWRRERGWQCHRGGQASHPHTPPPGGVRARKGPHLKVVKELLEGHLLTVRLQPLYLKAIPQRPLLVIVLRDKEPVSGVGATRGSGPINLPPPLMKGHVK